MLSFVLFMATLQNWIVSVKLYVSSTVDSRYLELQGTLKNTSRYPYFDISDLQTWGKNKSDNRI